MSFRHLVAATAVATPIVSGAFAPSANANERHFTFNYETAVLPAGARELELWTTPRIGRDDFYLRFDQRVELEWGLTDRLQSAFYLNFSAAAAETAPGVLSTGSEFQGVSSEWKYKVSDPVADRVGFGLYGEVGAGPEELELEAKLLFDKKIGNLLVVANLVGELELEFEGEMDEGEVEMEPEFALAPSFGLAYYLSPNFTAGVEVLNHNEIAHGEWEHSALFAGPQVAYATETWWIAATFMPQLPALKKEGDGTLILDEHERYMARVLLAFHI